MSDAFRPFTDPAQAIYDAFQAQAAKRKHYASPEEWIPIERQVVLETATREAERLGLRPPTLDEVRAAERSACGHVDYGSKWAYGVVEVMRKGEVSQ